MSSRFRSVVLSALGIGSFGLLVAGCPVPVGSGLDQDTQVDTTSPVTITVSSNHLHPAFSFTASAVVTIDWGDGSPDLVESVSQGSWAPADHDFVDSSPEHQVTLRVEPWSALQTINLGFRGGDGGNGESEMRMSALPEFDFWPDKTNFPDGSGTSDRDLILQEVGSVTAVEGLQSATGLTAFLCEFQPIQTLDLSGCGALISLEAFFSTITTTNFQGCTSLRRCCLESTGARYNWRVVDGVRFEDESLDLRDCPDLRDIRGTSDDHTLIRLHANAVDTLWHLCKMGNTRCTAIKIGDGEPALLDPGAFASLYECWISSSPLLSTFSLSPDSFIHSAWLSGTGITSLDISGHPDIDTIDASNNPNLGVVDLSGCTGLIILRFVDCQFNSDMVDSILDQVVGLDVGQPDWGYTLDLGGDNAQPSAAGLADVQTLRDRGWTVTLGD